MIREYSRRGYLPIIVKWPIYKCIHIQTPIYIYIPTTLTLLVG